MPPHLQAVAREYAWWVNDSDPFDVGATTATAFTLPYGQKSDYAATVQVEGVAGGRTFNYSTQLASFLRRDLP